MSIHVFGIRHHGPGCARSLLAALAALEPDIVLVEGPPDAQAVLPLLTHAAMRPPVALLVYAPDQPHRAAFYPFTTYSPEWQALRYALGRGIPARFIDLPQAVRFAQEPLPKLQVTEERGPIDADGGAPANSPIPGEATAPDGGPPPPAGEGTGEGSPEPALREDPIGMLAEAAGYDDHELWWEHQIEQRQ